MLASTETNINNENVLWCRLKINQKLLTTLAKFLSGGMTLALFID